MSGSRAAVLKSEDGKITVPLPLGKTALGRTNLKLDDKRVSRTQADITLERKNGRLSARLLVNGVNACYVKGTEEETYVGKGEEQALASGDTICFCGQSYPFVLTFLSTTTTTPSAISSTNKRKLEEETRGEEEEEQEEEKEDTAQAQKRRKVEPKGGGGALPAVDGALSLAFPSFGTGVFQYDLERAAQVTCKHVAAFLEEHDDPRIRLYAVDITESATLAAIRKCWKGRDARFQIRVANITKMKTEGIPCRVIANAANEWFSAMGSGVNLAINKAAGPALDKETKARYKGGARAGQVYPVPLPTSSPLRANEGVHHVVHVMAPNMNPQRNNCLHDDYTKGDRLLGQCYSSLLTTFWDLVSGSPTTKASAQAEDEIEEDFDEADFAPRPTETKKSAPAVPKSSANAFSMLMTAKKPEAEPKGGKAASEGASAPKAPARAGGWSDALTPYATHPEKVPPNIMHQYDDKTVCIFDKFPKAFKHLLVLPRRLIPGYGNLTADDVPLLKEMQKRGQMTVEQLTSRYGTLKFRLGFHAVPSMRQLHMHVISQDFDSEHLKTKKHWNSFTTEFFIPADKFIKTLETDGSIHFEKARYEAWLEAPLKCHVCHQSQKTMPALKGHLLSHA